MASISPCDLTILIASCNRRELLRRCLSALEHQTQDLDTFEIVVADDGSTDGTAEMVKGLNTPLRTRVLKLGKGGKSHALNAAIDATPSGICLILDDDIVASPELVAAHIAAHEANSKSIGIGALTQQPPEARDWYAHAFAKAWGEHYEELEHRPSQWTDCYGGNLSGARGQAKRDSKGASDGRGEQARLAHRPAAGGSLARPLGAGRGEDAGLRRQELVADPLDRRPTGLPADLGLGEALRLRTLLVLGGDRERPRQRHRPLRPTAAAFRHTLLAAE